MAIARARVHANERTNGTPNTLQDYYATLAVSVRFPKIPVWTGDDPLVTRSGAARVNCYPARSLFIDVSLSLSLCRLQRSLYGALVVS